MNAEILPMTENHWPTIREIYLAGIATGNATFERQAPEWDEWDAKHLGFARLVAMGDREVKGWAALSAVSTRKVYQGVAENSVYVAPAAQGLGLGRLLLERLIAESEANGIWTLQNSIFPENIASIRLHRSFSGHTHDNSFQAAKCCNLGRFRMGEQPQNPSSRRFSRMDIIRRARKSQFNLAFYYSVTCHDRVLQGHNL